MLYLLQGMHLLVLRSTSHFPVLDVESSGKGHHEPESPQICSPLTQPLGCSTVQCYTLVSGESLAWGVFDGCVWGSVGQTKWWHRGNDSARK